MLIAKWNKFHWNWFQILLFSMNSYGFLEWESAGMLRLGIWKLQTRFRSARPPDQERQAEYQPLWTSTSSPKKWGQGVPVIESTLPLQQAWVWSLVGELRSHMPCRKKKRKNGVNNSFYLIRSVQTLSGIIHVNNNGLIMINNNDLTLLTNLIMTF